jgi:peptidoglycan/xylan/chitin deacetylase (PgdA/CDA1 family)
MEFIVPSRYVHNVIFHEIVGADQETPVGAGRFWMRQRQFEGVLDVLKDRDDVVITFDDGFFSDVSMALPALARRGLTAKFFVTTANLGRPGYLRPKDVTTLAGSCMTVGSHGDRHISWRRLSGGELTDEVTRSRTVLEELIGEPVEELSMPSGQYNRHVLKILGELGFQRVYTVDGPWARADNWLQPRFAVTHMDTPGTIQAILDLPRYGLGGVMRAARQRIKQSRWW